MGCWIEVKCMKIRLAAPITTGSIVDGPGLRAVIWTQGCPHHCKGCHNPQTHSFEGGSEVEVRDIILKISGLKLHKGITISGGEPLEQAAACGEIAKHVKAMGMDVWIYTGYIFEDIIKKCEVARPEWKQLLNYCDVMVDGPFIEQKKNLLLKFRGSENQRLIDVRKSLEEGKVVLYVEKNFFSD